MSNFVTTHVLADDDGIEYALIGTWVGETKRGVEYYVTEEGRVVIDRDGLVTSGDDITFVEDVVLALFDQGERDVALRIIDLTGVSPEVPL